MGNGRLMVTVIQDLKNWCTNFTVAGRVFSKFQFFNNFLRWHTCLKCTTECRTDTLDRDRRKVADLRAAGYTVITITSCEWQIEKRSITQFKSPFSVFYYQKKISTNEILEAVRFSENIFNPRLILNIYLAPMFAFWYGAD